VGDRDAHPSGPIRRFDLGNELMGERLDETRIEAALCRRSIATRDDSRKRARILGLVVGCVHGPVRHDDTWPNMKAVRWIALPQVAFGGSPAPRERTVQGMFVH